MKGYTEGYNLLPDNKYSPLGSMAKLVTASKCATIEWISFPIKDIKSNLTNGIKIGTLF